MPVCRVADAATAAVVVPVRSFDGALSRLAGVLDRPRRRDLMRELASRVVAAGRPRPVHVVTGDAEVARWAPTVGASVIEVAEPGLNTAVAAAVERLAAAGVRRTVVAHADLPRAESLEAAVGPGLTIVPDRGRDGSNVVCVPAAAGFRFAYGPGSFGRHVAEAERLGLPVTVVNDPALAWDLDHPEDLAALGEPWPAVTGADGGARPEGRREAAGRGRPEPLRGRA